MSIYNKIEYLKSKISRIRRISRLNIDKAGKDNDGIVYIKLKKGPIFYGLASKQGEKKYYILLPKNIKKVLPFDCFQLANDIIIRYYEGGLKIGGPKKEFYYSVKEGDCVVEMGAYMGHYTVYLSEKVGKNGKIIAIEPLPENLKILRKNINENKLDNVSIVPKGVWKEKDEMVFNKKKGDNQSGSLELNYENSSNLKIEVDCLDNILRKEDINDVDLMIIQLNGSEIEALEGLKKYYPRNLSIAARYKKDDKKAAPIIAEMLKIRGYSTRIIDNNFVYAKLQT